MVREIRHMSNPNVLHSLHNNNQLLYNNEETLNSLLELAANIYDCNIGLICIYYKKQFFVKAVYGISNPTKITSFTFCEHIVQRGAFYTLDAALDKQFCDSPIVTHGPKLTFVTGTPLFSQSGEVMGSICVGSSTPKASFDNSQLHYLEKIANQVTSYLLLNNDNISLQNEKNKLTDISAQVSKSLLNEYDLQDEYVAQELHENFAQTLSATKSYLESVSMANDLNPQMIQKIKENINDVLKDVKRLSHSIMPSTISHISYTPLLQDYLQQFSKDQLIKIKAHFIEPLLKEDVVIPIHVFKILQYKLKNIQQRKPTIIDISFNKTNNILVIECKDDGKAITKQARLEKHLDNLHTRIALENGSIVRKRIKGNINYTKISIPLHK